MTNYNQTPDQLADDADGYSFSQECHEALLAAAQASKEAIAKLTTAAQLAKQEGAHLNDVVYDIQATVERMQETIDTLRSSH